MQNIQKITSVGYRAQNVCPETYGGPCTRMNKGSGSGSDPTEMVRHVQDELTEGHQLMHFYSGVHIRIDKPRFMKQIAYFWPSLVGYKNAITLQHFRLHFSTDGSFKMRYCMNFYLNWHRNHIRLKLKASFLLS